MEKPRPSATYEITSRLEAPLAFTYRWCTDYSTEDATLEREHYARRVLSRTPREVVYEDLMDQKGAGWFWSRHTVTLRPPNAWHSESVGSHRLWSLDYTLRELPDGATELTLRGTRTATAIGRRNVPRALMLANLRTTWKNFGAALAQDYRRSRKKGAVRSSKRSR